jgi:hypothetical protein
VPRKKTKASSVIDSIYVVGDVAFFQPYAMRIGNIKIWIKTHASIEVACPADDWGCGAKPGEPCVNPRTKRWTSSTHVGRRKAWGDIRQPNVRLVVKQAGSGG